MDAANERHFLSRTSPTEELLKGRYQTDYKILVPSLRLEEKLVSGIQFKRMTDRKESHLLTLTLSSVWGTDCRLFVFFSSSVS